MIRVTIVVPMERYLVLLQGDGICWAYGLGNAVREAIWTRAIGGGRCRR